MIRTAVLAAFAVGLFAASDQTKPGPGNGEAAQMAGRSATVQKAAALLRESAGRIADKAIRAATLDALQPGTCVTHRAGLNAAQKTKILQALIEAGLADDTPALLSGVFPPLPEDGSACPKLPQPFESAPGSSFGGHHSHPGGLPIHEAFNLRSALNFADLYQSAYGPDLPLNRDLLIAAPIWHDWAKTFVFQWNADGTEFAEITLGGGAKGDSKTPAHHILGLAETMRRGLPPDLVLTQASAHAAPVLGNEYKVVNWIRAAAMIAQIEPIARGYLTRDAKGEYHLPHILPEFTIHNLSDADFVLTVAAAATADSILKQLGPQFGFDPADPRRYNTQFRNPTLSRLTAERIVFIHASAGLEGVKRELSSLYP